MGIAICMAEVAMHANVVTVCMLGTWACMWNMQPCAAMHGKVDIKYINIVAISFHE